jgi:neurotransmitter:Na+ symporter, NSS family
MKDDEWNTSNTTTTNNNNKPNNKSGSIEVQFDLEPLNGAAEGAEGGGGGGGGSEVPVVKREEWSSRMGLVLAMAGQAVGLGNFLRFPRQVVLNGGGSFMVAYFVAFVLLGLPMTLVEWGLGRNGGLHGKGSPPGFFASAWHHPIAKYLGVFSMVITISVMSYYSCVESWSLAFACFSLARDYWGCDTQAEMSQYVRSFQSLGFLYDRNMTLFSPGGGWQPMLALIVTLAINLYVVSRGISGGIEKLARFGMPILLLLAVVLALVVLLLPRQADVLGSPSAWDGLMFLYWPHLDQLGHASVWLAAAGQIFFTLSVGMGSLATYASFLTRNDDIVVSALMTGATNEAIEVALGGTITIPAAVVFFGVSGAVAIAQAGSFDLGFTVMPVVFQQLPLGFVLGFMWFSLLFFAGITSSVALATPVISFLHEEFELSRQRATVALACLIVPLSSAHLVLLHYGFMDEWDYWAGTFGLVLFGLLEVIVFMWLFGINNAWHSIHLGADWRIPNVAKYVLAFVTPAYLMLLLVWWSIQEAWPILSLQVSAGGGALLASNLPFVIGARVVLLLLAGLFALLVYLAWRRNAYNDWIGFAALDASVDVSDDNDVAAAKGSREYEPLLSPTSPVASYSSTSTTL